jgi:hypothetical protein
MGNDHEIEMIQKINQEIKNLIFHEIKSFFIIKYCIIVQEVEKPLGALGG